MYTQSTHSLIKSKKKKNLNIAKHTNNYISYKFMNENCLTQQREIRKREKKLQDIFMLHKA